ncbi:hypothetical protein NCAS_0C04220 [Naumovozyma castellii]|uniref:Uncharacterized protein n=1 Tax=Naumovozyma castellii TaxID=27288 RepID=G0VD50_NAUCA|nr:hypothetical protein NCAS_0C04220 [Naumovozyma castellii CBS 4309]CCC69412.1 hypothetical protein NCAS_0C04220 [Naumovozyma castellii CBS 4309]
MYSPQGTDRNTSTIDVSEGLKPFDPVLAEERSAPALEFQASGSCNYDEHSLGDSILELSTEFSSVAEDESQKKINHLKALLQEKNRQILELQRFNSEKKELEREYQQKIELLNKTLVVEDVSLKESVIRITKSKCESEEENQLYNTSKEKLKFWKTNDNYDSVDKNYYLMTTLFLPFLKNSIRNIQNCKLLTRDAENLLNKLESIQVENNSKIDNYNEFGTLFNDFFHLLRYQTSLLNEELFKDNDIRKIQELLGPLFAPDILARLSSSNFSLLQKEIRNLLFKYIKTNSNVEEEQSPSTSLPQNLSQNNKHGLYQECVPRLAAKNFFKAKTQSSLEDKGSITREPPFLQSPRKSVHEIDSDYNDPFDGISTSSKAKEKITHYLHNRHYEFTPIGYKTSKYYRTPRRFLDTAEFCNIVSPASPKKNEKRKLCNKVESEEYDDNNNLPEFLLQTNT